MIQVTPTKMRGVAKSTHLEVLVIPVRMAASAVLVGLLGNLNIKLLVIKMASSILQRRQNVRKSGEGR